MLASVGVFRQDASDRFALMPLGDTLRAGRSGSVRDLAILRGAPALWQAWGELRYSILTGRSAFEHLHGTPFYEYMKQRVGLSATFNGWMTRQSAQHNTAVVTDEDREGDRADHSTLGADAGRLADPVGRLVTTSIAGWDP
jgi:hypothetical protein